MRVLQLMIAVLLLAAAVVPALALAADQAAPAEPHAVAPQESEEITTSDETLATSLFIPFCFVGATIAVFVWAIRNRAKRDEEEEPMPWWRTNEWYTQGDED